MSSSNSYAIDINIIEPSTSHNIRQEQSSSRIEGELSTNSLASSTSPTSAASTSTSTSNKSTFPPQHWLGLIVAVAVTIALVLGLVLGLHYRNNNNNNNNTIPIKQAAVCINQTTAFYQDHKQVQSQAQHSVHTLSHALPFHLLGLTQNGESLNGRGLNSVSLNGRDLNGFGVNGIGLNGFGVNGIGLNGFGVNGIGLNGIGLNGFGVNGIGLNGFGVNGIGLNGFGVNGIGLNGVRLNGENLNGIGLNGRSMNGFGVNRIALNGESLNGKKLNGVRVNGLDGFNTLQLQHGIPSNINGINLEYDQNTTQLLQDATASSNITTLMDVPLTGLKPNWTGALNFLSLSTQLSQMSHLFMKYILECALNDTQAVGFVWNTCDKDSTTHAEVFHGSMGLAPEWMNGPMLPENARFVSACLAARTNYYGVTVMISLRGPSPISSFINTIDKDEQQTFNATEGAFWGDIWSDNPQLYACYHDKPQDQRTYSRSLQRDCASGHINPTTGNVEECGPIHIVGSCSQSCQGWNQDNQYYTACRHNSTVPFTPQVITVALKSPQ